MNPHKPMSIGLLSLHLHLYGCRSLKEKRSRLKHLLARLHREFNVSAAEMGHLDAWQETSIVVGLVSNDPAHTQRVLQHISGWVDASYPDLSLIDEKIELL